MGHGARGSAAAARGRRGGHRTHSKSRGAHGAPRSRPFRHLCAEVNPKRRADVVPAGNFESTIERATFGVESPYTTVSFGRAAPPFATHSTAFHTTLATEPGAPAEEAAQSDAAARCCRTDSREESLPNQP